MSTRACIFLVLFFPLLVSAQCITPPIFPGCAPVGSLAVSGGQVINTGNTYYHSGTTTLSGITLNGGTLIVCGNLTLSSFAFNGGEIYVQAGSSFTVNNGSAALSFGPNSRIYNYGSTTFNASIVTGTGNILMNCLLGSTFTIPFDQLVLRGPNTYFVNYGSWQSSFFIVQNNNSPNPICLGPGSTTTTNTIINQFVNSTTVPSGNACLRVTQNIINSQAVTSTPNLYVFIAGGVSTISGPNWGNATIFPTCMTCAVPLPIELLTFTGYNEGRDNVLEWTTSSETNNCSFNIERSDDCIHFDIIDTTEGAIHSSSNLNYSSVDGNIKYNQLYYYRLKQVDCDGNFTYSSPIVLTSNYGGNDWLVWLNPASDYVNIQGPEGVEYMVVYNLVGQEVLQSKDNNLDISELKNGTYYVYIVPSSGETVVKELIVSK